MYYNLLFNIIFRLTIILQILVFFHELHPHILPFNIISIQLYKPYKLIQQFSMLFAFISFITTNIFIMRIIICLSFGSGIISMFIIKPPYDLSFILWYFLIFLINFKHIIILYYNKRHITFINEYENIYNSLFQTFMTRNIFNQLLKLSSIQNITKT